MTLRSKLHYSILIYCIYYQIRDNLLLTEIAEIYFAALAKYLIDIRRFDFKLWIKTRGFFYRR